MGLSSPPASASVWLRHGLLAVILLAGCPAPVPGACLLTAGHLCITAEAEGISLASATTYAVEVRVGDGCPALEAPPTAAATALPLCQEAVTGCEIRRREGPLTDLPRLLSGGELSADIDLTGHSGPVLTMVTLLQGTACLAHARQTVDAAAGTVALSLQDCAAWLDPCTTQLDCGAARSGRFCCHGVCVKPPPAPLPDQSFIPPGELPFGDPNPGAVAYQKACSEGNAARTSRITMPYYLDAHEATVKDYRTCVGEGGCDAPLNDMSKGCTYDMNQDLSINCLTSVDAAKYCQWRTKQDDSLPHEVEWEWAAGRGRNRYPWSADADVGLGCADSNAQGPITCPHGAVVTPGSFPTDRSPAGAFDPPLFDLGGNVAEWVRDTDDITTWFDRCMLERDNPQRRDGMAQIYRGAGWHTEASFLKSTARRKLPQDLAVQRTAITTLNEIGVRCVWRLPTKR